MPSTMDMAWEMARVGAPEGTVIIADEHSAGRGRYKRAWISEGAEDILCSIVLKWPNDVQINGRKLAGVIAESITEAGAANHTVKSSISRSDSESRGMIAVIGIGLNVNLNPMDHTEIRGRSTSLSFELDRTVDRAEVFETLMHSVDRHYSHILSGGTVLPAWREKLTTLGREVTVAYGKPSPLPELKGLATDVDSVGRLIVRDENQRDWPVSSGEVTIREIKS